MWSLKIFDEASDAFNHSILDLALASKSGIESALYYTKNVCMSPDITTRLRTEFSVQSKALHLSHAKLSLLKLIEQRWTPRAIEEALRVKTLKSSLLSSEALRLAHEAVWARDVQCTTAVIHLSPSNAGFHDYESISPVQCALDAIPCIQASWLLGIRLHLENTFESLAWLTEFYATLTAYNMSHKFGFTFDMGHSRVWKSATLVQWQHFMTHLDKEGYGLHFHIHGNSGSDDSHSTLSYSQSMGWLDADESWSPLGVVPFLFDLQRQYSSKSLLVLESNPIYAQESLGWVELALQSTL